VLLMDVPAGSAAAAAGLRAEDLVQGLDGKPVRVPADLVRAMPSAPGRPLKVGLVRGQKAQEVTLASYVLCTASAAAEIAPAAGVVAIRAVTTKPGTQNEPAATLYDGKVASNYGPVFANGVPRGLYKADLGRAVEVAGFRTCSFAQNGNRGAQHIQLFGSAADADPGWDVSDAKAYTALAEIDVPTAGSRLATLVQRSDGRPLGTFRWLVWVALPVTPIGEHTTFQEFQVLAAIPPADTPPPTPSPAR
jgi:membrane-associated protease RseP (regulator of RpoE activity)